MDLDDSYTERLLQSIKTRKNILNEKKGENFSSSKKRVAFNEDLENSDVPSEESPKRQCTSVSPVAYSRNNKENIEMMDETTSDIVPYHSAAKTRGLAALRQKHSNNYVDSSYSKAPEQQVNKCDKFIFSTKSSDLCAQSNPKSRLADLAANIRQWDDDTHTPTLSSKNVTSMSNSTKFQIPVTNTETSTNKTFSMKVFYTSKQNSDTNYAKKHAVSNNPDDNQSFSSHGKGVSTPACKKGNIEVGSVKGKWEKLQAWNQAITATLETPTSTNSPKKNIPEISSEALNTSIPDCQVEDQSEQSDESIDEDDFAENYHEYNGASNMDLDFSSESVKEKPNEPKKSEACSSKELKPSSTQTVKADVDPAELPLSARKALFENAFINGTPKLNDNVLDHKLSVAQRAAMFENATKANSVAKIANLKNEPKRMAFSNFEKFEKRNNDAHKSPVKSVQPAFKNNLDGLKASPVKQVLQTASPAKKELQIASSVEKVLQTASPVKKILQTTSPRSKVLQASPVKNIASNSASFIPSPTKGVGSHTRLIQQKLMTSTGSNWQEKQAAKAAEERKQEISSLVNHWEKLSSSSSADNNSELEKTPLSSEEKFSCKSVTIDETTENESEMHKSEDESEMHESEDEYLTDDESENNSVVDGKENHYNEYDDVDSIDDKTEIQTEAFYYKETKTGSLTSVKENSEQNFSDTSTHTDNNTRSFTSSSCYSDVPSTTSDSNYHASASQSCSSGSSVRSNDFSDFKVDVFLEKSEKKEKNPEVNLLRTISTYRREKQETKLTPVRTVVRREKVSSPESLPDTDLTEVIQQHLKELQDEILRQQIVIRQTSQALNLCSATAEFSGSTEQVEGERHLLIATQKRQACLNEIQRLKTCGAQGENLIDGTGALTITDLQLPLKREFIASQLEGRGNDTVHYFLCLIRHGAQVIVTQMMSTEERSRDGTLSFTNHIQLRNLPADFSVVFEVYALQTKKEVLPHEKKYHIKRENSKRRLTPKGKKTDNKIPAVSSPGGPNAVRSPSFGVVGFTRFNLQNCNKKTFTLDKVPFASPLEGVLRVQIKLHADHKVSLKGFLTFYEDVGEIGALYRRWCVLDRNQILYWLYPDDELKKEPLGSIDLRQCVTDVVKSVSTLECARSHTFKLVTVRPQKKGDKNTLISKTVNTLTTTKHLLTADTKDERILWCNKINEALENVRKWDPQALHPIESINI